MTQISVCKDGIRNRLPRAFGRPLDSRWCSTFCCATPCWREPTSSKQLSTVAAFCWFSVWSLSCRCRVKFSTQSGQPCRNLSQLYFAGSVRFQEILHSRSETSKFPFLLGKMPAIRDLLNTVAALCWFSVWSLSCRCRVKFSTQSDQPCRNLSHLYFADFVGSVRFQPGGVLPYKRLMGMCRWMGSHFHDWID